MKLLLTVLVLIVLPTAWLSLLAGRSIQARELLLDRRLETEAQQTLEEIGNVLQQDLATHVTALAGVVADTVLVGADIRTLDAAVASLQDERSLQGQVYLFLNPWGFIHPEAAIPEQTAPHDHYVLLAQELSARISRGAQTLVFGIADRLYRFGKVDAAASLYVGFEVQKEGLLVRLEEILQQYSTPHIEYRVLRIGAVHTTGAAAVPRIEVRDTFSQENPAPTVPLPFARDARRAEVLVAGHLRVPLDFIEIGAIAVNARDMYAARALQARLVRWSIFLLACVLLSSTAILLLLARRQAARARLRSIFIAGLSHDIRTPVTAMRALAESLQQGRVTRPERQQQFLDSIVAECDRLQTLIDRVLLFFRQEQGGYHRKQTVDLVALCERVGNTFCARHRGRVDFRLDLPEAVPGATMWADATALEQALHNLLENAWKYGRSEPGHPDEAVTIGLRLRVGHGCIWRRCLVLAVEDAGPGVAARERQRVFHRFYRGDTAQVRQSGGIGLGLALVREIVRGHGGRVDIGESAWGGARFEIRFKPFPWGGLSWRMIGAWLRARVVAGGR